MLQSEDTLKLQDFIKKKFPEINSEEAEKISRQFMDLALCLVRLKVKDHFKPPNPQKADDFSVETTHPP